MAIWVKQEQCILTKYLIDYLYLFEKIYEKKKPSTNSASQSAFTDSILSQKGDVNTNAFMNIVKKYMDNNKEFKANI